jgi:hypothetical protein
MEDYFHQLILQISLFVFKTWLKKTMLDFSKVLAEGLQRDEVLENGYKIVALKNINPKPFYKSSFLG